MHVGHTLSLSNVTGTQLTLPGPHQQRHVACAIHQSSGVIRPTATLLHLFCAVLHPCPPTPANKQPLMGMQQQERSRGISLLEVVLDVLWKLCSAPRL
jgi:hypothetical protein